MPFKLISQCPVCGRQYSKESARQFANKNKAQFIHLGCDGCKSNFMAVVMILGTGISTLGMVTDLGFEDAKRLYEQAPLSVDDVIEGYKNIKHKDFFNQLFV